MKTCKLLLLLLALALLFCACANTNEPQSTTGSETTTTESTPKSPLGVWFSEHDCYAVEFHTVTSATLYKIQVGFFRYTEKTEVSCDDITASDLQFTTADGKTLKLHYDSNAGTLTNAETQKAYVKQSAAPLLYHSFPAYDDFDYDTLLTLGDLDALTYPEDARSAAARDIFEEVYANIANIPTLTDRQTAQRGDYVNIDFTGYLNGEKFSGGEATNKRVLLVSDSGYIPGFAEGIVGHTVDETFSVDVTFPEDYGSANLAGKSVTFEMKLNSIYKLDVSDEQVKVVTKDAYTTYASYLAELEKTSASNILWNTVLEASTFSEIPEEAYLYFYQYFSDPYREYAKQYGLDYETFLSMMVGITDAYILDHAKNYTKGFLLAYAIAKQEGLTVSDEELQAEVDEVVTELLAQGYTAEEISTYLDNEQKSVLKAQLLRDKASEWLLNAAQNQ